MLPRNFLGQSFTLKALFYDSWFKSVREMVSEKPNIGHLAVNNVTEQTGTVSSCQPAACTPGGCARRVYDTPYASLCMGVAAAAAAAAAAGCMLLPLLRCYIIFTH